MDITLQTVKHVIKTFSTTRWIDFMNLERVPQSTNDIAFNIDSV